MKFVWEVVGVPAVRWRLRMPPTCVFTLRCTFNSLARAWRLARTNILMLWLWSCGGRYNMCGGSFLVRPNLGLRMIYVFWSKSLQRGYGGCSGSGLKLISVLSNVLCTYIVAGLVRCLLLMVLNQAWTV